MRCFAIFIVLTAAAPLAAQAPAKKSDANRLAYLDELDPYYPHRNFAKLITPQWVGDKDVDCVVVLAIDDMRDPKQYEAFLRPILNRLKEIDGRAALSIMTCNVNPQDPQLQTWLKEGLSLECHTVDHPCPFFKGGFAKAKDTYDRCVDLMHSIPNNKPVAFRMPCCDSLNTPSPRFWAEIFNKTTAKGNFLSLDSSVFNVFTSADPELPRDLVLDESGQERFRRYLPADRTFVNTIENYPYPYVIGRLCWEFPCVTPSDWEAQHLQKPNNPKTVRDLKAALDCAVVKKGVFCLVFHPHGWIRSDQVVELIDHAVAKHGKKVKFLNFREAQERLDKNLLVEQSLRLPSGADRRVRIVDLDNDGFMDVVLPRWPLAPLTRHWLSSKKTWKQMPFPAALISGTADWRSDKPLLDATVVFGTLGTSGQVFVLPDQTFILHGWHFADTEWVIDKNIALGFRFKYSFGVASPEGMIRHARSIDVNGDGVAELMVCDAHQRDVYSWSDKNKRWRALPFEIPGEFSFHPSRKCSALFVDLDGDGKLDLVFSNEKEYGVYLFTDMEKGWSKKIMAGKRGDKDALPMISRSGTNNGCWVHSGHLWWSNEDTVLLKDHVDRRSFKELLGR
jgi:hypothetical protein